MSFVSHFPKHQRGVAEASYFLNRSKLSTECHITVFRLGSILGRDTNPVLDFVNTRIWLRPSAYTQNESNSTVFMFLSWKYGSNIHLKIFLHKRQF